MIMKIKDLTIGQIIEIANKYNGACNKCPLFKVNKFPCYKFCDLSRSEQVVVEKAFERKIKVDLDE